MPSLTNYFDKTSHKSKWFIGDRVEGKWNGIPFVGSVLVETYLNEEDGPKVTINVDLPILYKNEIYTIITLKPKDLKARK